jgi:tetratricopeptide (TPR) repeat protein
MPSLGTLDRDASLEICFRCHALKDAVAPGFLPGGSLEEYYSLLMPLLSEDAPVYPDGRIRTFAYQQGHLWSDCFVSGSMTCTDCHDPHSQRYRDANGQALTDRFADGQCTSCHPSKADRIAMHTHHVPSSPGSRCVACHMPYLQEPEVGSRLRYARSDHVIPVPRPAYDASLGLEVACQNCHRDMSLEALEAKAAEWWGELKPLPPAVRFLMAWRAGDSTTLDSLLQAPTGNHTAAEFMVLGTLLRDRLTLDTAPTDPPVIERLRSATASENTDVAALGLAALHYSASRDRRIRELLQERATQLGLEARAVRNRWAVILGYLADQHREQGEWDAAIATYRKALDVRPAHSATLMNLGLAFAGKGQPDSARAAYLESVRVDERNSLAYVNLGILLAAQGDEAGAITAYQQALQIDSRDGLAWFNLGNVHLRAGRAEQAAQAYERATQLGPAIAQAYFNRARALIPLGRLDEAARALRTGLEFQRDTSAALALRELESRTPR